MRFHDFEGFLLPYDTFDRVRESNAHLSDRLMAMKTENKALREAATDFERVKQAFGLEEVERVAEDAKRREQAEKSRKKSLHSFDRGGR